MIAVVFALEFESAVFRAKQDQRLRVDHWILGAMGTRAADRLARKLEATQPQVVVSAGFAGGLREDLQVGDKVLVTNYSDPSLVADLALGSDWKQAALQTAPAIVEKADAKRQLAAATGAGIVDLETAHLAAICADHRIPLLGVRCVSDAVADDMPIPAALLCRPEDGRPDPFGVFRHLVTNPGCVGRFNHLLKNAKTAQVGLAAALEEILPHLLRRG